LLGRSQQTADGRTNREPEIDGRAEKANAPRALLRLHRVHIQLRQGFEFVDGQGRILFAPARKRPASRGLIQNGTDDRAQAHDASVGDDLTLLRRQGLAQGHVGGEGSGIGRIVDNALRQFHQVVDEAGGFLVPDQFRV